MLADNFVFLSLLFASPYGLILVYVLFLHKSRTIVPDLHDSASDRPVTVVIAARNEAENLKSCLESLLTQSPVARVIIVDDHSTDGTGDVAAAMHLRNPEVELLSAPFLPAGWVGKSHALHFGAASVTTPLLLFTDADVVFGEGILARAVRMMKQEGLDHLGGHFFVDCQTIAEEICAPVLVTSSALALFGTAHPIGAATGAFNMVRSEPYFRSGGHESIKTEVVDDVALARSLKRSGAKSEFVGMGDNLKVRLFVGFNGFISSVTRSAIPFLRWGSWLVCGATAACMLLALGTALLPIAALIFKEPSITHAGWGMLPFATGFLVLVAGRPFHNGRMVFHLLYPAALFLLGASVFRAALDRMRNRTISWRGRKYPSQNKEVNELLHTKVKTSALWES